MLHTRWCLSLRPHHVRHPLPQRGREAVNEAEAQFIALSKPRVCCCSRHKTGCFRVRPSARHNIFTGSDSYCDMNSELRRQHYTSKFYAMYNQQIYIASIWYISKTKTNVAFAAQQNI